MTIPGVGAGQTPSPESSFGAPEGFVAANEFAPLESSPPYDPHAPVDYPTTGDVPSTVAIAPYAGAYPYAADPYDPYRATAAVGTSGMAIAALVTSLISPAFCGLPSVVGLILGISAMRETRKTGQVGHGLALTGAIIGGVITVIWVVFLLLFLVGLFSYEGHSNY